MEHSLDSIFYSIKQLSQGDKLRILYFLQEEQKEKPTNQEITNFFSKETKKINEWNSDIEQWLEESKKFVNEIGIIRE